VVLSGKLLTTIWKKLHLVAVWPSSNGDPSVFLSLRSQYCTRMADHRIMQTTMNNSQGVQLSDIKDLGEIPIKSPPVVAPHAGGVSKIVYFDRSRSLQLDVNNLCSSATEDRNQDGCPAVICTVMWCHQQWWMVIVSFITLTAQL